MVICQKENMKLNQSGKMNLSAFHRDNHMKDNEINIGDVVWFQAYRRNYPIQGKVIKKGSQIELGCGWAEDDRVFYALETIREDRRPFVFTRTTCPSIFKEEPPQLIPHEVYDDETGISLYIMAWDMEQAVGISETIDFNDYKNTWIVDVIDEIENYVE